MRGFFARHWRTNDYWMPLVHLYDVRRCSCRLRKALLKKQTKGFLCDRLMVKFFSFQPIHMNDVFAREPMTDIVGCLKVLARYLKSALSSNLTFLYRLSASIALSTTLNKPLKNKANRAEI